MTAGTGLRDFRSYGRLEAFNALLVPGVALYYGWPGSVAGGIVLGLGIFGLVIGLVAGALYWLALAARLDGDAGPMRRALRVADTAQRPMLATIVLAATGVAAMIATHGWSPSNAIAASVALLAALEYVNYYRVQLQHFDRASDWRRLLGGRGFRRAHMARDLARWRQGLGRRSG